MTTPPLQTLEEIRAAVEGLSPAELLRLRSAARFLLAGMGESRRGESWEDLLQEAILRLLTGVRRWPAQVDLTTFLIGTMRSIASSWVKRTPVKPIDEVEVELRSKVAPAINLVTADAFLENIRCRLSPDETDLKIFECMLLGMNGPETANKVGITLSQYQSAVKRIRRKIKTIELST